LLFVDSRRNMLGLRFDWPVRLRVLSKEPTFHWKYKDSLKYDNNEKNGM